MANIDRPRGFELIGYKNDQINGSVNAYYISASYTVDLVVGDPVVKTGTSNTTNISQGSFYGIGTLPEINRAVEDSAAPVIGIITGFEALEDQGEKGKYNLAGTERVALVSDDPNALYRAQFSSSSVFTTIGSVGLNFDYVFEEDPDLINGFSGAEIHGPDATTLATHQFKFERFEGTSNNEVGSAHIAHAKGIFSINHHQGVPNTAGV